MSFDIQQPIIAGSAASKASKDGSDIQSPSTWRSNLGIVAGEFPGMFFDGATSSTRILQKLSAHPLGSGDFSVWLRIKVPATLNGANRYLFALSSSSTTAAAANGFAIYIASDGTLVAQFFGATTSDIRSLSVASFQAAYAAKITDIVFTRTGTTTVWYVNGSAVSATTATSGSPPAFSNTLANDYVLTGALDSTTSIWNSALLRSVLFNRCLSASDVQSLVQFGIDPSDQWGNQTALANFDFAAGVGSWFAFGGTTVAAPSGRLVITYPSALTGGAYYNTLPMTPGKKYRVTFVHRLASGTFSAQSAEDSSQPGAALPINGTTLSFASTGSDQTHSAEVLFAPTGGGFSGSFYLKGAAAGAASVEVDNFQVVRIGAIFDLDLGVGIGGYFPDRSTNLIYGDGGGGLTHTAPRRNGLMTVAVPYLHSDISTTAATTKAFDLPPNCALTRVELDRTVAFDAACTLNIGTAANQTLFVSGLATTALGFINANSASTLSQSNSASTPVYVRRTTSSTVGNLVAHFTYEIHR